LVDWRATGETPNNGPMLEASVPPVFDTGLADAPTLVIAPHCAAPSAGRIHRDGNANYLDY
jgi:hypothetical protein